MTSAHLQPSDAGAPMLRLDRFLAERRPPTPCIVLDLDIIRARFAALRQALPATEIYYAVKANPAPEIGAVVAALGGNFDLASLGEIDICLDLRIPSSRLSFGNTVKPEAAIARAAGDGIGLFEFDSAAELEKWPAGRPERRSFADC